MIVFHGGHVDFLNSNLQWLSSEYMHVAELDSYNLKM